jgi:hypothetical protein
MPSYLNKSDKVKDWMVDVFVFANQFNEHSAANASFGYCFNVDGTVRKTVVNSSNLEVDGLSQLANIKESGFIGTFTGSMVQGFKDEVGNVLDITNIINSYVESTGLIVCRNEEIFDEAASWVKGENVVNDGQKQPTAVDFRGHNFIHLTETGGFDEAAFTGLSTVNQLSYTYNAELLKVDVAIDAIKAAPAYDRSKPLNVLNVGLKGTMQVSGKVLPEALNKFVVVGQALKPNVGDAYAAYDGNLATVQSVQVIGSFASLTNANNEKLAIQPFGEDVGFPLSRNWYIADGTASTFVYADAGKEFPKNGSGLYYVYPTAHPLAGLPVAYASNVNGIATKVVHNPNPVTKEFVLPKAVNMTIDEYATLVLAKNPTVNAQTQILEYDDISMARVKAATNSSDLLLALTGKTNLEYVYEIVTDKNLLVVDRTSLDVVNVTTEQTAGIITDDSGKVINWYNLANISCIKVHSSDDCTTSFKPVNLKSYVPRNRQFLDGTAERQSEVLSVLNEVSIDNGLQNQDLIDWMYIIDGFKSYIEPNVKYQLKNVAKKRITGRAIYNLPFIKDFARSTNPYFSSTIGGDLEMKYVAAGGNFELPYSNSFSLPVEDGYFAYGFSALEYSGGKIIPSAGIVSNLFAAKHQNGKPYGILAGNPDGIISGQGIVGPEHVFIERNDGTGDRDYLEPAGWNLILRKNRVLQIYSNKTSYTTVNSPVGSIHTSEVVMFLQLRIKALLDGFVFKYNTANNRMRIVEKANDICDEPKGEGAISGYVNKMDDFNNTKEVIANRIGILDTTIYANNGMEIIVHRTRIDMDTNAVTFEIL